MYFGYWRFNFVTKEFGIEPDYNISFTVKINVSRKKNEEKLDK